MDVSKDILINVKTKIFDENITTEDKEEINKKINDEINKVVIEFEKESEPIDE